MGAGTSVLAPIIFIKSNLFFKKFQRKSFTSLVKPKVKSVA